MRVKESPCPTCGKMLDGAGMVGSGGRKSEKWDPIFAPKPGDVTVCVYCGTLAIFGAELQLTEMTETQFLELAPTERRMLRTIQALARRPQ